MYLESLNGGEYKPEEYKMSNTTKSYLVYVIFNNHFKVFKKPLSEDPVIFDSIGMISQTFGIDSIRAEVEVGKLVPYRGLLIREVLPAEKSLLSETISNDIWCDVDEYSNRWACYDQIGDRIGGSPRLGMTLNECLDVVGKVCTIKQLANYVAENADKAHVRPIQLGKLFIRMIMPMEIKSMINISRPLIPTFKKRSMEQYYMIFNNGKMEAYDNINSLVELFSVERKVIQDAINAGTPIKGTNIYHGEIDFK